MSVVLLSIGLMLFTWLIVCLIGHGYSNTIDHWAYILHRHAVRMRQMHGRRSAVVQQRWVEDLERHLVDSLDTEHSSK